MERAVPADRMVWHVLDQRFRLFQHGGQCYDLLTVLEFIDVIGNYGIDVTRNDQYLIREVKIKLSQH